LKELHPEHFETLSSVRVPTHAAGDNSLFYKPQPEEGYPVLNLHPVTGELMAVRYNNDDRSALQTEPAIVEAWQAPLIFNYLYELSDCNVGMMLCENGTSA
jgi:trimethyllysine dioxygenase